MVVGLPPLWTWNIGMNSDPSTREDGHKATPHDIPDRATMCEVDAMI